MSARDDYPYREIDDRYGDMCDEIDRLRRHADRMEEALKDRRRSVLTRGGGLARRVVADPAADTILADYHAFRHADNPSGKPEQVPR